MKQETRRERRTRKEKIRRKRRCKAFARVTFLFSIAAVAAVLSINVLTTVFAKDTVQVYTVVAAPGDTLWDLAREYNVGNNDLRKGVDRIMRANNMKTTAICAGDEIIIPIG